MTTELLTEAPLLALAGLLDVPDPPRVGEAYEVPLLWHWIYLMDRPRQDELGADGHRRWTNEDEPELTARMFASGSAELIRPLVTGQVASVTHHIESSAVKEGRSGRLQFVNHRYDYAQAGELCVVDRRTVVYRRPAVRDQQAAPASTGESPQAEPSEPPTGLRIVPSESLLMRFSALTYNAHRIHYDRGYAASEGYPDLVVHGPLQAIAMAEAARQTHPTGRLTSISYRMLKPAFLPAPITAQALPDGTTQVVGASGLVHSTGQFSVSETS